MSRSKESKIKIAILKNEDPDSHKKWELSCRKRDLDFQIIDLTKSDWFELITDGEYDIALLQSPGLTKRFKILYNERVLILKEELGMKIFPTYKEILLHENKIFLSYWLKSKGLPHPDTKVFYHKTEALHFIRDCRLPVVFKTTIGASGRGVQIIYKRQDAIRYLDYAFSERGVRRDMSPNIRMGKILKRIYYYLKTPKGIENKIRKINYIKSDPDSGYVIVQDFIPHEFEWRCVRIGDSFFAHKKSVLKGKASGSLKKEYITPPFELFDFIKDFTDKNNIRFVAVDLFESGTGKYLINEIQCFFGQSDPYQMLVDGIPGRYIYANNAWQFEPGDFNSNESYDLRLEYILSNFSHIDESTRSL
jgi:glutathione synthase/RimK-type ligase-like ATP-grasp enzyme